MRAGERARCSRVGTVVETLLAMPGRDSVKFYPDVPAKRRATVLGDIAVVCLLILFAGLGLAVHGAVDSLAVLGTGVREGGTSVQSGFGRQPARSRMFRWSVGVSPVRSREPVRRAAVGCPPSAGEERTMSTGSP